MLKILGIIKHQIRLRASLRREKKKAKTRSPRWPRVEKQALFAHPTCAGCGSRLHLQVHHKKPFHSFPQLELEPTNLIVMCMSATECHLRIGHGDHFRAFNPNVELDAAASLRNPESRPSIWAKAKAARVINAG